MERIERVVVDEGVGRQSVLVMELHSRLGERPVEFVFLASEHPGIPDIEILDKLLDARSALLTQDRVLHNLAIGRGFRSFVHTPESGLTDRRLAHVAAPDRHLPVAGALRSSARPRAAFAFTHCGIAISLFFAISPIHRFAVTSWHRPLLAHQIVRARLSPVWILLASLFLLFLLVG
jgi:hypothetical protein